MTGTGKICAKILATKKDADRSRARCIKSGAPKKSEEFFEVMSRARNMLYIWQSGWVGNTAITAQSTLT